MDPLGPAPLRFRLRQRTTLLIVHDSHSLPSAAKPLDVLRWQGRKMGLLEIGYHLIIDRDGCVHRIRDVLCVGSHCPGYNHLSVGVCLIGGLGERGRHEDNFTDDQRVSLAFHCVAFLREWPDAQVRGHNELKGYRQVGRKACPSLNMDVFRETLSVNPGCSTLTEMTSNGRLPEDHSARSPCVGLPHVRPQDHAPSRPHDSRGRLPDSPHL